ncbi:MAG: hypothetical protein VX771_00660, partial [Pseudomonadota bacterium]|nr:hypothetical protein [Pseudomonadota bacterium]
YFLRQIDTFIRPPLKMCITTHQNKPRRTEKNLKAALTFRFLTGRATEPEIPEKTSLLNNYQHNLWIT